MRLCSGCHGECKPHEQCEADHHGDHHAWHCPGPVAGEPMTLNAY
jgi:hypothetical protein